MQSLPVNLRFRESSFDPRLVVTDARIARSAEGLILLVWFEDQRCSPPEPLAAWWDFAAAIWGTNSPDPDNNAALAKAFLEEEVFHAGGPFKDRPRDAEGTSWAELDWDRVRGHRLPPITPSNAP